MNRASRWAIGLGLVLLMTLVAPQQALSQYMGKSAGLGITPYR